MYPGRDYTGTGARALESVQKKQKVMIMSRFSRSLSNI